jgi:hypothetical protein
MICLKNIAASAAIIALFCAFSFGEVPQSQGFIYVATAPISTMWPTAGFVATATQPASFAGTLTVTATWIDAHGATNQKVLLNQAITGNPEGMRFPFDLSGINGGVTIEATIASRCLSSARITRAIEHGGILSDSQCKPAVRTTVKFTVGVQETPKTPMAFTGTQQDAGGIIHVPGAFDPGAPTAVFFADWGIPVAVGAVSVTATEIQIDLSKDAFISGMFPSGSHLLTIRQTTTDGEEKCDTVSFRLRQTVAGTSCYPSNPYVYTGQTAWFPFDRGDGSFDFNCDGSQTPMNAAIGSCQTVNPSFCGGVCTFPNVTCVQVKSGWVGTVAACGGDASWYQSMGGYGYQCAPSCDGAVVLGHQYCH